MNFTEQAIDNFTLRDGSVRFFNFVKASLLKTSAKRVLDFGAGRGAAFHDTSSVYKIRLRDLREYGAEVTACDVDPVVLQHPASNEQVVIDVGAPLPFQDGQFDVIVSDMTFEHITTPDEIALELLRVLSPGGIICVRTPNVFGYVSLITSLIPNRAHKALLKHIQPDRQSIDIFPTTYKMNSVRQIKRLFKGCQIFHYTDNGDPAYHFNNPILYRLIGSINYLLPKQLRTSLCVFIEKGVQN